MSKILAISSYVARGHIGLGAIVPVLNGLGYEVTALPSVLYSNHPGHDRHARQEVSANTLAEMLVALDAQGWLHETRAVLTGYLPTADHVAVAADAVRRVKALSPEAIYLCDPVLGDDPDELYLDEAAAGAIRETLLPIADILNPNRFELAWLTETRINAVPDAIRASRALDAPAVCVTSLPVADGQIANLLVTSDASWLASVPRLDDVPHGTGDMMGALVLGHRLDGLAMPDVLSRATASLNAAVRLSAGSDELSLSAKGNTWLEPADVVRVRPVRP